MARAVGYMDDLFFQMKIAETAKQLGVEFKIASNPDGLNGLLELADTSRHRRPEFPKQSHSNHSVF